MAQRAIREYDGKRMIAQLIGDFSDGEHALADKFVQIGPDADLKKI